ncbi:hypothetical protein GPZ77_02655 [Streptomyces sp. QHH-9511]|nr:hypothetical protein GPZ77_02655 [Streptomyces sp. QHH-9511]
MAVVISIVGGRRTMISAATGAVALVIPRLNRERISLPSTPAALLPRHVPHWTNSPRKKARSLP